MNFQEGFQSARQVLAVGIFLITPFVVAGCASTGTSSGSGGDIIGQEEIEEWGSTFSSAYQIVEQLRPHWLRKRGTVRLDPNSGDIDYIVIYEDRNRMGDPEALRTIAAQNVREIQRYSSGAAIRFGPPDHPHGAIIVRTKTGM